ncbi:MAG: hypothetical protein Q9226_003852 [Calogaya cf. arnoldii]
MTLHDSIWRHIPKPNATLDTSPPSLNDGAIFSNDSSLWLYGGEVSQSGELKTEPPIPPNYIWRYDWGSSDWSRVTSSGEPVQRLITGPYTKASDSRTYYLGGQKSANSDALFKKEAGSQHYAVGGLLTFDGSDRSFQNVSTGGLNKAGTMFAGFLTFIPSVGSQGVLVAFGGVTLDPGADTSFQFPQGYQISDWHWPMQNISVYDIGTQVWHQQQASGDTPSWRYQGCAVAVSAPDGSSHSIYVFGGWGATNTQMNDGNIYVLSIPSLTWIRVTLDIDQRSRHQCHLMGNHHMLVVGGSRPWGTSYQPQGLLGCDIDPKFRQGLGIFSLNNHTWTTDYDPEPGADPYQIHPSISKVIGGNATGGATKRTPDAGFSSVDLRKLMSSNQQSRNASITNTTAPEPPSTPPKLKSSLPLSKGVIAGIAVGATIGAFIIATVFYLIHHRRQSHQKKSIPTNRSISRPSQPVLFNEAFAAPAGQELRSGTLEDSLAKMYRSHEVPNTAEIHEMPTLSTSHELPALPRGQATKIPLPNTLHPAFTDEKKSKGRGVRQQMGTAKK